MKLFSKVIVILFTIVSSTPVKSKADVPLREELENKLEDELKVEEKDGEEEKREQEDEEEVEEDMEWDQRNTDSVFSELSELSRDYLESVDQGASVRGKLPFSGLFSQTVSPKVGLMNRYDTEIKYASTNPVLCCVVFY